MTDQQVVQGKSDNPTGFADWQAMQSLATRLQELNSADRYDSSLDMFGDLDWLQQLVNRERPLNPT